MCGLAGVVSLTGRPLAVERLKPMVDALAHRGPDDAGYLVWQTGRSDRRGDSFGQAFTDRRFQNASPLLPRIDSPSGRRRLDEAGWDLFLGHRRLAVIDLSPRAHQPFSDRSGRSWLVFNGEIYDHRALREQLAGRGVRFRSDSDTEVLLEAWREWGEDCVHRLNGMFAFAHWDGERRRLTLARDRYGIKPLYYAEWDDQLVFASEIKSLLAWRGSHPGVDLLALDEYFTFQNVLSDRTLFEGVRLLPPGHVLEWEAEPHARSAPRRRSYWDFDFDDELSEPAPEIEEALAHHLDAAVRRQCVSDVPLGSYLSGGMDSATVASLCSSQLGRILTFTLGFDLSEAAQHELHFDERARAERLANLIQSEHYECVLHSGDMEAVLPDLVWSLEDLRCGQSYPNYYVSRLAGKFVKVVLTGVGGDELFGGYPWRYAAAIAAPGEDYVDNYCSWWQRLVPDRDKPRLYADAVGAQLRELRGGPADPFAEHTREVFRDALTAGGRRKLRVESVEDQVRNSLYFECKTFLHGLLVVEDKLSMAHSLETRVPYLDNELVDFACRVPIRLKVAGIDRLQRMDENRVRRKQAYMSSTSAGKHVLRRSAERMLPAEYIDAPKQGFSAPDESWFRGRSADWVRGRLADPGARLYDFLDRRFVDEVVASHQSGESNRRLLLWSLLSFQTWLERFGA